MAIREDEMAEAERFRRENDELRELIGLGKVSSGRPETFRRLEKENEMLKNQQRVLEQCTKLLASEEGRKEALFILQLFHLIPLPVWVSTLNAKIAYWNDFAERAYNHKRDRALGRNFIDLFVSEAEREQAEEDLVSIIFGEEGSEHFNLCKDKDNFGREVHLVTCCFPVHDSRRQEIVQAEISFDLRQLDTLKAELEDMYVKHKKKEEEARRLRFERDAIVIKNLVDELFFELKQYCNRERTAIQGRMDRNREMIENRKSTVSEKETHKVELNQNLTALEKLDQWDLLMQREIAMCGTVDEHNAMKKKLWGTTRKNV